VDGWKRTVKTACSSNSSSTGRTIKGVRQQRAELNLDFEENGDHMQDPELLQALRRRRWSLRCQEKAISGIGKTTDFEVCRCARHVLP
jgi:hypothetical protein